MARLTYPTPTVDVPSEEDLCDMLRDAVFDTDASGFETSDGCHVEPDGTCPHGHPTWLVRYGLI